MANDEHVALLKKGVDAWNEWRLREPLNIPDLSGTNLSGTNLTGANLTEANLSGANFSGTNFSGTSPFYSSIGLLKALGCFMANDEHVALPRTAWRSGTSGVMRTSTCVRTSGGRASSGRTSGGRTSTGRTSSTRTSERQTSTGRTSVGRSSRGRTSRGRTSSRRTSEALEANLYGARLWMAKLSKAKLLKAVLARADLEDTKLGGADLRGAKLQGATLVRTDLTGADLTGCRIYGVSAWELKLETTKQQNLVITSENEPEITVDNIEVAQFIYLMLNNQKVRDVIDTITSKAVLILGRFTDERKAVLDALREELRKRDYLPILFDFDKPRSRDTDETITLLARMARFIVADISDAKAVLQELRAIVPDLPSVPVQPIILAIQEEPGMFDFYRNRPSFLTVHRYASQKQLLADLGEKVIRPAELKVLELRGSI